MKRLISLLAVYFLVNWTDWRVSMISKDWHLVDLSFSERFERLEDAKRYVAMFPEKYRVATGMSIRQVQETEVQR